MTDTNDSLHVRFRQVLTEVGPYRKDATATVKTKAGSDAYSYDYADVNSILAMLKPVLHEKNLTVYQPVTTRDQMTYVDTHIGDLLSDDELVFPGMAFSTSKDPQAAGSAITYFRRYCLVSLFALQAGDDDGSHARAAHEATQQKHPRSDRVARIGQRIRQLAPDVKEQLENRYGGRIMPSDLLEDEVKLTRVEEWVDALLAPKDHTDDDEFTGPVRTDSTSGEPVDGGASRDLANDQEDLTARASTAFEEIKQLDAAGQQAVAEWAGKRSFKVSVMAGEREWLEQVEAWLDERKQGAS